MPNNHIDDIDRKILKILQKQGRITNLQLSQEIGLSPAPTLERVRKLEKGQYILSYHAKVNNKLLGFGLQSLIHVTLERQIENAIQKFLHQIEMIE